MKTTLFWPLVVFVSLLRGACSPSPAQVESDYGVRFVTPRAHALVSDLVNVQLDRVLPEDPLKLEVGVEGQPLTALPKFTTTLRLDSRRFSNGQHRIVAKLTGVSGQQWSASLPVEFRNPDFALLNYSADAEAYSKGQTIHLRLNYPSSGLELKGDFSALDDRFDATKVVWSDLGGGAYALSYELPQDDAVLPGLYEVVVRATDAAQATTISRLALRLRAGPRIPLTVANAIFVDGEPPPTSPQGQSAPTVERLSGVSQLLSGVPQTLDVQWQASPEHPADRILVAAQGYSGYYVLPVEDAASFQASIPVALDSSQGGSNSAGQLDLSVAIASGAGAIGAWLNRPIQYQLLSAFAGQVTLSWNSAADLDLKVTTPTGNTVSYAARHTDGGTLELDANGMCSKSHLPAERIFWAPGKMLPGRYTVSAEIYDACGTAGADFTAVVTFCGITQTLSGHFAPGDARTDKGVKRLATIDVDCVNHLYGHVEFERKYGREVVSPAELAAYVPVRAVSTLTNLDLARTTTDGHGRYDLYLPAGVGSNYYLEVEASYTPAGVEVPLVQVMPQDRSSPYVFTYPGVDTNQSLDTPQHILVTVAQDSGALNIVKRIIQAHAWMRANFAWADANKVTPLVARWSRDRDSPLPALAPGQQPPLPPIRSYYQNDTLFIGGLPYDTNEHDDPVIVHEFFHHVWRHLGLPSVGGAHASNLRVAPALAMAEGTPTALGQQSLGYPEYWDTFGDIIVRIDLENRTGPDSYVRGADLGTADGTMAGNVNEDLVAAVLWDLMDPSGGHIEPSDEIDSTAAATLLALARHLPPLGPVDRGAPGADLVDLLDGWRCAVGAAESNDAKLRELLDERQFNYDFAVANCP